MSTPPDAKRAFAVNGSGRLEVYNGGVDRAVPATPCLDDARHRQFDFWVGTWDMNGQRSVVRSLLDGCLIEENYMPPIPPAGPGLPPGPFAVQGRSINAYDRDTERWHQTWVSPFPQGHLRMNGNLVDGVMRMGFAFPGFVVNYEWEKVNATDVVQRWTFNGSGSSLLYKPREGVTLAPPAPFPFCQPGAPGGNNRRLDFLNGTWSVQAENGPVLGESAIASDMNGCLMREDYNTDKGYAAHSYLYFDLNTRRFHRTYIDSEAERFEMSGTFVGSSLVLTGNEPGPGGKVFLTRNTITPIDANTVQQTWETTNDGVEWTTDLILTFTRASLQQ